MRNAVKIAAVAMALLMVLSLASCSLTKPYSYKTDSVELPYGVYIYNLYSAYSQAQSYAQKSELYDSEAGTYDGKKSFLKMEITDDDGKTATADEWIVDKADEYTRNILAIYTEFDRLSCTIDEATLSGYKEAAQTTWDHGPYYQYYGEQYDSPYSDVYEPLGISFDSFYIATYYASAMQEEVFNAIYGATGTEAVSDEDLTAFFTENYTSYCLLNHNLYTTESAVDENGEETTNDVPLSEADTAAVTSDFKGYVARLNAGESYDDVIKDYMTENQLEEDPSQKNVEIMSESSIGENLVPEIEALEEGKASYKAIGDEPTQTLYLFYKAPIADSVEQYIGDETQRHSILEKMKKDDFEKHLDDVAASLDVSISGTAKSFDLSKFES